MAGRKMDIKEINLILVGSWNHEHIGSRAK